jgi:uncharacterized membrane protein
MIGAFVAIAGLTAVLVLLNVHQVVLRFLKDRDRARLLVYLTAVVFVGSFLIQTAYKLVDHAMDAAAEIHASDHVDA